MVDNLSLSFVSCTEIQSQIPQQSSERPPGPSRCVAGADVLLRRGDGRGRAAAGPRGRCLLLPTAAVYRHRPPPGTKQGVHQKCSSKPKKVLKAVAGVTIFLTEEARPHQKAAEPSHRAIPTSC